MKALIQRVAGAKVEVAGQVVGSIDRGMLIFLGVTHQDTAQEASRLAAKLVNLRIFDDGQGKMNKSLLESNGQALIVSQFTLYADCSSGRRPAFIQAAKPELAKELYELFINEVRKYNIFTGTGIFGAEMQVSLQNDGPVTLMLETPQK